MTVFYRKYRPSRFAEIVGQEHVISTILNALIHDQFGHAYLFVGPRGTGKTSVARLIASALNCTAPEQGEPCRKCVNCLAVSKGNYLDLVEIDAASNRGIDDVRELRDKVNFQPVQGQYRVYVLDEVHMLTREAFNALLKTLEEPPGHVKFVLCTTEAHKLPVTVVSRCQRFDFKLADAQLLINYLKGICKLEKIKIDKGGLELIAQQAAGSYRDAINLLEQISSHSQGMIKKEDIINVLGLTLENEADQLLNLIGDGKQGEALLLVDKIYQSGKDIYHFMDLVIQRSRDRIINVVERGEHSNLEDGLLLVDLLQTARIKMPNASLPQLPLELVIIRYLHEQNVETSSKLVDQGSSLDQNKKVVTKVKSENMAPSNPGTSIESNFNLDGRELTELWSRVMEEVKPYNHSVHALLKACHPDKIAAGVIYLNFDYKFHKERIEEHKNKLLVEDICSQVFDTKIQLRCYIKEQPAIRSDTIKDVDESSGRLLTDMSSKELSEEELIKLTQEILGGEVIDV